MSIGRSSGTVTIDSQTLTAYSVQISASGGAAGGDTIDVTSLTDTQIQTMDRTLKAAGAASAKYSVTVEYFGLAQQTSSGVSVTLPVIGQKSGCTVSSSSVTYAVNDAVRGSVTILVP
jgi:hypothetical protein